jgi:hypothetical protein
MKTLKTLLTLSLLGSLMAACNWSKNPASDIEEIRAAKRDATTEPQKEIVYVDREVPVPQTKTVYVDKEKPVEVIKTVYVDKEVPVEVIKKEYIEKEVPVYKEQATLDGKYIAITADAAMKFMEGQTGTFKVLGRTFVPGMKVELSASNLPAGATFQKTSDVDGMATYELKWSPTVALIPSTQVYKMFEIKITPKVTEAPKGHSKEAIQKLLQDKEVTVFVIRSQKIPSEVAVEGLDQEVTEGTITTFYVTAKVHGFDDQSGEMPFLKVSYDNLVKKAGVSLLQLDGTRHVVMDPKQAPAYLGDFKWKFTLSFDTKNVSVEPAVTIDKKLSPTADATPVRMSFRVVSPLGADSPEFVKEVNIKHTTSVLTPKFDVADLTGDALELVPGETATLKFKAGTLIGGSTAQVEVSDISSLKGSPKITCATDKEVKSRRACTLTWSVPCEANEGDLNQSISMSAVTTLNGKNSDATSYVLKTVMSKKTSDKCAKAGATP